MMVETWKNDAQILERSIYDGRILETWVDLRAKQEPCGKTKLETLIPGSLLLPFRLTLPLGFNSSRPLDTSVRSCQRFHPVHVLLPSVSSHSCGYVLPFVQVPIQYFR